MFEANWLEKKSITRNQKTYMSGHINTFLQYLVITTMCICKLALFVSLETFISFGSGM
jgi:hypothetical protein